jgi:hypothetical protein
LAWVENKILNLKIINKNITQLKNKQAYKLTPKENSAVAWGLPPKN